MSNNKKIANHKVAVLPTSNYSKGETAMTQDTRPMLKTATSRAGKFDKRNLAYQFKQNQNKQ